MLTGQKRTMAGMKTGTSVGMAMALTMATAAAAQPAEAAPPSAYGPAATAPPPKKAEPAPAEPCPTLRPTVENPEIIVCVTRPEGYRLDPDVVAAERAKKANKKLKGPERMVDRSCATVGPMGCRGGGGINLLAAAMTAAEMARRAAKGENVGEMFITDPQPDEYQLYLQAKREREARDAAAKALAASPAATKPVPAKN